MKINIKSIIICVGLIIIVYLLMLFKEKFHPTEQVKKGNKIDIPSHYINNVDYDNYMKVGDGIEGDVSDNSLPYDKINICNECKTQKCDGLDCLECDNLCSFTSNNETTMDTSNNETTMDTSNNETTMATSNNETTMDTSNNETTMDTSNNETTMATMDTSNNETTMTTMATSNNETTMATMDTSNNNVTTMANNKAKYAIISFRDLFKHFFNKD
jgi:hypothetical protein